MFDKILESGKNDEPQDFLKEEMVLPNITIATPKRYTEYRNTDNEQFRSGCLSDSAYDKDYTSNSDEKSSHHLCASVHKYELPKISSISFETQDYSKIPIPVFRSISSSLSEDASELPPLINYCCSRHDSHDYCAGLSLKQKEASHNMGECDCNVIDEGDKYNFSHPSRSQRGCSNKRNRSYSDSFHKSEIPRIDYSYQPLSVHIHNSVSLSQYSDLTLSDSAITRTIIH